MRARKELTLIFEMAYITNNSSMTRIFIRKHVDTNNVPPYWAQSDRDISWVAVKEARKKRLYKSKNENA